MNDTTARGNGGVIVDKGTAGTGTLTPPEPSARPARVPRQGKSRTGREGARPASARVPGQAGQPRAAKARAAQPRAAQPRAAQAGAAQAGGARSQRAPKQAPPRQAPPRQAPPRQVQPRQAPPRQVQAGSRPRGVSPTASNRMPFIVLLCGLLGGALASALVINTTLAEGSFEISKLQHSDAALARQRQQLQDQVSQAQSAPVIQQRAYQLGMRPSGQLRFVNLKTGKIEGTDGSPNGAAGYAP